jgi:hypothetical protein
VENLRLFIYVQAFSGASHNTYGFARVKAKQLALTIPCSHPIYKFGDFVYLVAFDTMAIFRFFGKKDFVDVVHLEFAQAGVYLKDLTNISD